MTVNLELDGKVALVTGSSAGIGFAIAKQLAEERCRVVLNGRNAARLEKAQSQIPNTYAFVADVCDLDAGQKLVQGTLDQLGRLDILVCNVGSGASLPPGEETPDEWHRVMNINLYATTQTIWAASKALQASGGNIICISSICGIEALGCPIPYAAAKAALESYVRNAARSFGRFGVRINSIAPGNILFTGSVWDRKLKVNQPAVNDILEREVALQRLGQPEDIAHLTAYLASPLASFITGATYVVDGGQLRS